MTDEFTRRLLHWDKVNNFRKMPWKGESDPYKIWLSEIILQQTRVDQGWAYYEIFIRHFPTIDKLAQAPEDQVFKLWEGLGYYNRCKNLIITARKISFEYKGRFPNTYEEVLNLKGIGPYTAAAICSFAFKLPYAVVDGNVERVISRYFAIDTPVDQAKGKKLVSKIATNLLDKKEPGIYNQAIMDFGATICKPKNPLCSECLFADDCQANRLRLTQALPIKSKKLVKRQRWFNYFIVREGNKVLVKKRDEKDIWANLFEFMLLETKSPISVSEEIQGQFLKEYFGMKRINVLRSSRVYKHELTHQTVYIKFFHISNLSGESKVGYKRVDMQDLNQYAFPKPIAAYLTEGS
jgi:A/G-specific adenine glycosylase